MRFEKLVQLRIPRPELWTFLANTERFNQEIGLPPERYTFSPHPSRGSVVFAEAKIFGQEVKWREMPFEWVEPRWFRVRRIYDTGPFREIVGGVELDEEPEGTRVTSFAEVTPRNLLGKILAPILIGRKALQDYDKACRNFEAFYQKGLKTAFPRQAATAKPVDRGRLTAMAAQLREARADETLLARLLSHIEGATDADLIRFRPFELADAWRVERLDVLRLWLQATRAGLLDLEWSVLCPSCRGVKQAYSHLRDLQPKGHCDACNIEYGLDFDRFVEVQRDIHALHREHPELPPLVLKLGAHSGPCIAVNANDQLDYFGTTVNVAQLAQDQSAGSDMVITDRMLADPEVRSAIEEEGAQISRYESKLKGFEAQFVLYRILFGEG